MSILVNIELPEWFFTELSGAAADLVQAENWHGLGEDQAATSIQFIALQRAGIAGIRLASGSPEYLGAALLIPRSARQSGGSSS